MSFKKLVFTEIRVAFDLKFFLFFILILVFSTSFPFIGIIRSLSEGLLGGTMPEDMKKNIGAVIDGSLLIRFSLTIYLLAAWGFIPKMFYNSKLQGEVESVLAIGYSGKKIWISKATAVLLTSVSLAVPLIFLLSFAYRWYCNVYYNISIPFNAGPVIFALLVNPLLLAGLILFVGGFQLLSDDVRKSSMSIFVLGILNIGLMFGGNMKNLEAMQRTYGLIYSIAILLMFFIVGWLSSRMESENILMSSFKKHHKGVAIYGQNHISEKSGGGT